MPAMKLNYANLLYSPAKVNPHILEMEPLWMRKSPDVGCRPGFSSSDAGGRQGVGWVGALVWVISMVYWDRFMA